MKIQNIEKHVAANKNMEMRENEERKGHDIWPWILVGWF